MELSNWKSQIRKGLLEYGLLNLIKSEKRLYGLEILAALKELGLPVTEGTLYPLLSRLVRDQVLSAQWETSNSAGHPRKYYQLGKKGKDIIGFMDEEWRQIQTGINRVRKET